MNLIQNKQQFENFTNNVLAPLLPNEVYFVSLSARTKYLSPAEKDFYGLGNTTMFARTIVRNGEWNKAMRSLEGELSTRLTNNGFLFPEKALVVYVNVNPSDSVAAHMSYVNKMNVEIEQVLKAQMRGKTPNFLSFTRAERMLQDCFQTETGSRHFIDIDIDTKEPKYCNQLVDTLLSYNVEFYVVETHGGFHVLVKRATLNKSGLRLDLLVSKLAQESGVEIMFNKNNMIPMPGTLQAGHLVKVVK